MDITGILLDQFLAIPPDDRARVIETAERNKMRMNWDLMDLQYLFLMWNTYVSPQDSQDIKCSHCRHHVVMRLRQMAKIYLQHGGEKQQNPGATEG